MSEIPDYVRLEAKKELARRYFYDYCSYRYPQLYKDDRVFLKEMCDSIQDFVEQNNKRFLIINLPPRHMKSLTATNLVEWLFGQDTSIKVMTGSYNETLSSTFARKVRDTIDEQPSLGNEVYNNIFPKTKIKYGQASKSLWSLEGNGQDNYLATSPTGTATGFGANYILIDDIIKNAYEAFNRTILQNHWDWFCLAGETKVHTPTGEVEIKHIRIGDSILTYNHDQCIIEPRKVVRTKKQKAEVYTLRFTNGQEITATGNHRFWTGKKYQQLEEILREMWGELKPGETVLFNHMQKQGKTEQTASSELSKLHQNNKNGARKPTKNVLLYGMSALVQGKEQQKQICYVEQNQRRGKTEIQKMPEVPEDEQTPCTPHRPQQQKQRTIKFDSSMPIVPYQISQATRKDTNKLQAVYDIEVEGNHNFFAEGVLTHNTNTMIQRTEGDDWKVIAIMTRWAKEDLAGRIIDEYGDLVQVIQYKAVGDDGKMLCDEILNKTDYEIKTRKMSKEIVEANYNQKPIDVQGRLYDTFMEWDVLPETEEETVLNYTDTADKGTDYLCSVSYKVINGSVYILDVVMSDEPMEITEPKVAMMLDRTKTTLAYIEANNGGRGFRRNVERELAQMNNNKCTLIDKNQTSNKEARILTSSAWIQHNVYMPKNWLSKYPDFATQLLSYQRKGKNEHDDAPDVLAGIYELTANTSATDYSWGIE
jgi:predicted phage terminase large subunit-like protein